MVHPLAAEMAPTGTLRAAINMRNMLLVTGKTAAGDPEGLAPSLAAAFAEKLGVPVQYVPYDGPGALAEAAAEDAWDIALIGADPDRAAHVTFTAPYCEIEAAYMVPEGSSFQSNDEVDSDGTRIAVCGKAAYDLWLERNIKKAQLVRCDGHEATYEKFLGEKLEVLAGLRSKLSGDLPKMPELAGMRILPGRFMAVEQAACTKKGRVEGFKMLSEFVEEAKASGMVEELMEKFGVRGSLSVAPPAAAPAPALLPPPDGAIEIKVTAKKGATFYARAVANFLKGTEARPAEDGRDAVPARPPVDALRVSGLGDAVNVAVAAAAAAVGEGLGEISRVQTAYPAMEGSGSSCPRIVIDLARTR
mmetsp:Transcript_34582/g.91589  ORF Transcript_34582/g.91589 Transcript_34582/m.91589 type:complete len:361 (+) Transcript_34582:84-1166(+)